MQVSPMSRFCQILAPILLFCSYLLSSMPLHAHQDLILQIEQLDVQISNDPQNTELLMKRGDLYRRHGDWIAADDDFQMVRELAPGHPRIDWYQGHLYVASGRNLAAAPGTHHRSGFSKQH